MLFHKYPLLFLADDRFPSRRRHAVLVLPNCGLSEEGKSRRGYRRSRKELDDDRCTEPPTGLPNSAGKRVRVAISFWTDAMTLIFMALGM